MYPLPGKIRGKEPPIIREGRPLRRRAEIHKRKRRSNGVTVTTRVSAFRRKVTWTGWPGLRAKTPSMTSFSTTIRSGPIDSNTSFGFIPAKASGLPASTSHGTGDAGLFRHGRYALGPGIRPQLIHCLRHGGKGRPPGFLLGDHASTVNAKSGPFARASQDVGLHSIERTEVAVVGRPLEKLGADAATSFSGTCQRWLIRDPVQGSSSVL